MNIKIVFNLGILLNLVISGLNGQSPAKFEPTAGKMILIIGQDMGAIGGFQAPNNNGYVNHINVIPGGVTTYTSLPTLAGLASKVNYGAGDACAQCIINNPIYNNSVLSLGLYMVDQETAIANGAHDQQIKAMGKWIKDSNRPVFLRIGYEFDGNWNHYKPLDYKRAYQRIVKIFDTLEVKNCATVWQACTSPVDDIIEAYHENINDWYPGDEFVDWIGYSWFVNTSKQIELTDEVISFARTHKKPVMVCESSVQGYDLVNLTKRNIAKILDGPSGEGQKNKTQEEIWNEWFKPFFDYIEKNKDVVKIVAYINVNWDAQKMWGPPYEQGYWGDTRVEANEFIKKKWLETISTEQWLNASPTLFKQLNFTPEERSVGYRSR